MPMAGTFKNASGTKAGTQSLPTPMPMSVNAATEAEIDGPADYKSQVNGIVPGYSGHVPRARDKYAASAHGGIAPERGPHVAKGPQTGHVRPEDVLPPHFVDYVEKSRGVMPGYCGFRPESVHVKNVSAYGGIPHQGMRDSAANAGIGLNFGVSSDEGPGQLQQGNRGGAVDNCSANLSHNGFEFRRAQDVTDDPPSFRDNVGGVLPGYTGHVRACTTHRTYPYHPRAFIFPRPNRLVSPRWLRSLTRHRPPFLRAGPTLEREARRLTLRRPLSRQALRADGADGARGLQGLGAGPADWPGG